MSSQTSLSGADSILANLPDPVLMLDGRQPTLQLQATGAIQQHAQVLVAPKAADLPRFNGSIHDYVRMLRVTKEAATKADPAALIATGGIGYPTFLAALLPIGVVSRPH